MMDDLGLAGANVVADLAALFTNCTAISYRTVILPNLLVAIGATVVPSVVVLGRKTLDRTV